MSVTCDSDSDSVPVTTFSYAVHMFIIIDNNLVRSHRNVFVFNYTEWNFKHKPFPSDDCINH